MHALAHIFVGGTKVLTEINDARVVLLRAEIAHDAFRVQVAHDGSQIVVTVCHCTQDTSHDVDHLMLFEEDLSRYVILEVSIWVVVAHYVHPVALVFILQIQLVGQTLEIIWHHS